MTSIDNNALQTLMDRANIHDLLNRYYQGIDRGSMAQVESCFTEDVRCWYDGRPATVGRPALMDSFLAFRKQKTGEWKITTHFMGNLNFNRLEADSAEVETNAIAFLVQPQTTDTFVNMRSLRYVDQLVKTSSGWLIQKRVHTLDWSCQVPATFAKTTAERIVSIPVG